MGFAVALLGILSRFLLIPPWGVGFPVVTFCPAVLFAAVLGGFGAGVLATLVLAIAAAYLFLDRVHAFRAGNSGEVFALALFISLECLISLFVGSASPAQPIESAQPPVRPAAARAAAHASAKASG